MRLKIKNFNIIGVHQFLGEGLAKEYIYIKRRNCLKRGLGQYAVDLAKKREVGVFEGGRVDTRDAHFELVLVHAGT